MPTISNSPLTLQLEREYQRRQQPLEEEAKALAKRNQAIRERYKDRSRNTSRYASTSESVTPAPADPVTNRALILRAIGNSEAITVRDIANTTNLYTSYIDHAAVALMQAGHVTRQQLILTSGGPGIEGRNVWHYSITEAGIQALANYDKERATK